MTTPNLRLFVPEFPGSQTKKVNKVEILVLTNRGTKSKKRILLFPSRFSFILNKNYNIDLSTASLESGKVLAQGVRKWHLVPTLLCGLGTVV